MAQTISLQEGYFLYREIIEKDIGHNAFLHRLREMETLEEIEGYLESIQIKPENFLYLFLDIQRIASAVAFVMEIYKKAYSKINEFLSDGIAVDIDHTIRLYARDDFEEFLSYIPGGHLGENPVDQNNVKRSVGDRMLSLLHPHTIIAEKINVDFPQYKNAYNVVRGEIYKYINSDTNFGLIDGILIASYDVASFSYEAAEAAVKAAEAAVKYVGDKLNEAGNYLNNKANEAKDWIVSFSWKLGVAVAGLYLARTAIQAIFTKRNPPENLFEYAKKMKPDIKKYDFDRAISVFRAQHGRMPNISDIKMVRQPPGINLPICVEVGKVPQITYDPPSGKKSPYKYKHDMYDTKLVSDTSGNNLFLIGKTYLDTSDGWLKK